MSPVGTFAVVDVQDVVTVFGDLEAHESCFKRFKQGVFFKITFQLHEPQMSVERWPELLPVATAPRPRIKFSFAQLSS